MCLCAKNHTLQNWVKPSGFVCVIARVVFVIILNSLLFFLELTERDRLIYILQFCEKLPWKSGLAPLYLCYARGPVDKMYALGICVCMEEGGIPQHKG